MRPVLAAFFVLALYGTETFGADLTGHWAGPASTVDDGQEFVLVIKQAADGTLTGHVLSPHSADVIVAGKADGAKISVDVERPGRNNVPQKVTYTGVVEGATLKLTLPMPPGGRGRGGPGGNARPGADGGVSPAAAAPGFNRPPQILDLVRTSSDPPGPLPPRPALVSLPMHEKVGWNGLSKTPPMGWNSWNKFHNRVSDKMVREIADALVTSGMKAAGYVYVNIDDTWEGVRRDAQGNMTTNNKFPDMKALADYVHSKGLKLGLYSSPGPKTCADYEGSYQHEEQDAKTFAAWGIDFLKYDWCTASKVYDNTRTTMTAAYAKMGRALLKSGRKIVYSLCQYGKNDVGEWGELAGGNLWRTTQDISDSWRSLVNIGFDQQVGREKFAKVGHWNDPDMLEIGNGGMSDDEYRTHMSLWSLLAAPLLAGNDVRDMKPNIAEILMNKEVIAVDQDKLGKQAARLAKEGDAEIWSRQLAGGAVAVGLFNRGAEPATMTARWKDLGLKGSRSVRDLWTHTDLGKKTGEFSALVPPHGVALLRIK